MTAVFTLIAMMASSAGSAGQKMLPRRPEVAALKESLAANQAALKSYTWTKPPKSA
jgi:hypothetical protein